MKKLFLYTSIYTALGAALACFATDAIFELSIVKEFYCFIFLATLCTYNMHWYFTPEMAHLKNRENWSVSNKKIIAGLAIASLLIGMYLLYNYLWQHVFIIIPLVAISILYTAPKMPFVAMYQLRKFIIGKTLYLALAWTYATVVLPILINTANISHIQWQYIFHRFIFIFIICGLFDYKDRLEDKQGGIKSMIAMAGLGILTTIVQVLISASLLSNFRLVPYLSTVHILLNFLPIILLMLVYKKSIHTNNEVMYYFILDGLLFINGAIYAVFYIFKMMSLGN